MLSLAEPVGCAEQGPPDFMSVKLPDIKGQGITIDQIPCIALQFPLHIVDESWRAKESDGLASSQGYSKDCVEADEVV